MSVVDEHFHGLIALGFFVGAQVDAAAVEAVDVRAGESQQDRGVCDYDELCSCFCAPVDLRQQCELPLRGQRCLRFVHDVQAVRAGCSEPAPGSSRRGSAGGIGQKGARCRRIPLLWWRRCKSFQLSGNNPISRAGILLRA